LSLRLGLAEPQQGSGARREASRMTEMSFLEHLQELRKRLIVSFIALFIGMAVAWPLTHTMERFIQRPLREPSFTQKLQYSVSVWATQTFPKLSETLGLRPEPPKVTPHKLNYMAPLEPFFVQMKISLISGLALAFPVILYQLWLFLAPAMYENERKYAIFFVPFGTVAFVLGDIFFLYLVWPLIISFSLAYESDVLYSMLNLSQYVTFCLRLLLLFGLIFELPLVFLILSRTGLVTVEFMKSQRRLAILLSAVIAAFHADLVTMTMVAVPMYMMYELSILLVRLVGARQPPAPAAAPVPANPADRNLSQNP
jgi:sec-independent protein translocase protein TatC